MENSIQSIENDIRSMAKGFRESLKQPKVWMRVTVLFVCLGITYYSTFAELVSEWIRDPDYSHGFLIPIISLCFIWQRRSEIEEKLASPSTIGLPLIISGLTLLVFGNLASESFTMRISFLIVLIGISIFLLGWAHLKILLLPIGFLIFMIPIPSIFMQQVTFPMQLFASRVAEASLRVMDLPVLREGNVIYLPHSTLEVAEACSGIRSLMSLLALGVVFAFLTKDRFWQRVVLVLACFPIAIIVNSLRVSTTGILANYYGIAAAEGFFHGFSGYVLFIVAFAILLGIGVLLSAMERDPGQSPKRS
jgi:exosortase